MIKKLLKYFLSFLILVIILIIYLSYFGIETKRFNQLIKNEVIKNNQNIDIQLKKVKIIFNLRNFSVDLKTYDPDLIFDNKIIKLKNIKTNFSIESFLKKEFAVKNLLISTKENNLKDIISLSRIYKNTPQLYVFNRMVKKGIFTADINLNFDDKGKVKKDYIIKGSIKEAKISLLNKQYLENIVLNFEFKDNLYLFNDSKIELNKIKLLSKKIQVKNLNKNFLIEGDIKHPESFFDFDLLSTYFKNNFKELGFENINFSSNNNFSFTIDKKFKFSKINIKSKINLKKLNYSLNEPDLKNYLPNYKGLFEFYDHEIELVINKDKLSFIGKGNFIIDKISDKIDYNIQLKDDDYIFKTKIRFNNNSLLINFLNYKKDKNKDSLLSIDAILKKDRKIFFKKISFKESKNQFFIKNLNLNKNFKIEYFDNLGLNFLNKNKIQNQIYLKKNKKNYEINGKSFDATKLIDDILNYKTDKESSSIFSNLNSNINVKIDKTYLDGDTFVNNLEGNISFKNNKINKLNLDSIFPNNKELILTINTNQNNEKITTLFSAYPKPLVKRYKFIKGFEEGVLDFHSIKKGDLSNSVLIIDNFKVKEVPIFAKLLTLASLQGIADLLTGEGIRFTDFEMKFSNKKSLMTIDEIYAIGPAVSIMMDGYIESKKLISLRGTLVPATTVNRVIASIPLIGNLLVGKKSGEGVFGVSFKIKGPPKDLKTTVNPVKTLTPRFITRTLEKIKKN